MDLIVFIFCFFCFGYLIKEFLNYELNFLVGVVGWMCFGMVVGGVFERCKCVL